MNYVEARSWICSKLSLINFLAIDEIAKYGGWYQRIRMFWKTLFSHRTWKKSSGGRRGNKKSFTEKKYLFLSSWVGRARVIIIKLFQLRNCVALKKSPRKPTGFKTALANRETGGGLDFGENRGYSATCGESRVPIPRIWLAASGFIRLFLWVFAAAELTRNNLGNKNTHENRRGKKRKNSNHLEKRPRGKNVKRDVAAFSLLARPTQKLVVKIVCAHVFLSSCQYFVATSSLGRTVVRWKRR